MILPLLLSWFAVTQDCRGNLEPEPMAMRYEIQHWHIRVVGYIPDQEGWPTPVYQRDDLMIDTGQTFAALPEPGLGEVIAYLPPVAVDAAGWRSDDPCPS